MCSVRGGSVAIIGRLPSGAWPPSSWWVDGLRGASAPEWSGSEPVAHDGNCGTRPVEVPRDRCQMPCRGHVLLMRGPSVVVAPPWGPGTMDGWRGPRRPAQGGCTPSSIRTRASPTAGSPETVLRCTTGAVGLIKFELWTWALIKAGLRFRFGAEHGPSCGRFIESGPGDCL